MLEFTPRLVAADRVTNAAVLDDQGAGHSHRIVIRVTADEAQHLVRACTPDVFKNFPGVGVESAEGFVEQQDVPG